MLSVAGIVLSLVFSLPAVRDCLDAYMSSVSAIALVTSCQERFRRAIPRDIRTWEVPFAKTFRVKSAKAQAFPCRPKRNLGIKKGCPLGLKGLQGNLSIRAYSGSQMLVGFSFDKRSELWLDARGTEAQPKGLTPPGLPTSYKSPR